MNKLLQYLMMPYMFGVTGDEGGGPAENDLAKADRGDVVEDPQEVEAKEAELTKEEEDIVLGKEEEKQEEEKEEAKEEASIPKSRFDEARTKAKEREEALLARNKELEDKIAQTKVSEDIEAVEAKINDLTKQHAKLLSDGELDKAADVFAEIRKLDRAIAMQQATAITEQARTQAREDIKMDALVAKYESDYPFLNPDDEGSYNSDAVDEVVFLRKSFEQQGLSRTQALTKAVQYVVKAMAPAQPDAPEADKAKGLREDRTKDAMAKKVAAAKAQAPDATDTGTASDKIGGGFDASSVMHMTQEEFSKLPERELAKLRGDSFA